MKSLKSIWLALCKVGNMQMTCCCGDVWLTNAREQSWDGLARGQQPCCSRGASRSALLLASWGTLVHWVLLLLFRTTPEEQRKHVQLLGPATLTSVSSRAHGMFICPVWGTNGLIQYTKLNSTIYEYYICTHTNKHAIKRNQPKLETCCIDRERCNYWCCISDLNGYGNSLH